MHYEDLFNEALIAGEAPNITNEAELQLKAARKAKFLENMAGA